MAVGTEGHDGSNQLRDLLDKTLKMRHGFQSTHEPVLGHLSLSMQKALRVIPGRYQKSEGDKY